MESKIPAEFPQLQALTSLGSEMSFTTLLRADNIANLALSMAIEFTGASRGYLVLLNEQGCTRYSFGMDPQTGSTQQQPPEPVVQLMNQTRDSGVPAKGGGEGDQRPYVCVPLRTGDTVVGILYLDRTDRGSCFEPREERLAELAAGQLAISLTARFLYEQMIEKRKQVELLDRVGKAVNSPGDLDQVLALAVETAREALHAEGAALLLIGDEGEPVLRYGAGTTAEGIDLQAATSTGALIREAIMREAPQVFPKPGAPASQGVPRAAVTVPLKLVLREKRIFNERRRKAYAVPFTKILGILYLENRTSPRGFSEDDQFVLQVFADHITTTVTHDALVQQASTDTLTGLASRQHLDLRLAEELEFAERSSTPLSVVLLDIDDFKGVNDTFGHQTGDEILRQVGTILRGSVRKFDICGRYGGEEFILALPETEIEGARIVAENIRERIASTQFIDSEDPVPVTVSLGVATYPTFAKDLPSLINAADTALYTAKRDGKNRHAVAAAGGKGER